MKILIAYRDNLENDNLFVQTLVSGLRSLNISVDLSLDLFWDDKRAHLYDIIHIHWPEELFRWEHITDDNLRDLRSKLSSLRDEGVKMVYTRHNLIPHYSSLPLLELYSIVETYSTTIVHMGDFSRNEFDSKYPGNNQTHAIIAHHIYENEYDEQITQKDARTRLGISTKKFVILSFGKFRQNEEMLMVLKAFCLSPIKNRYLLAPRFFPFEKRPQNKRCINRFLSVLGYYVVRPLSRCFNTRLGLVKELVSNEDLPVYFAAADVVFIQRINILNSGNIPSSFLFKKVVVGPDCGNISEILRATGNPTFDPHDHRSIVTALKEGYSLSNTKKGFDNYHYARSNWGIEKICKEYKSVYENSLSRDHSNDDDVNRFVV